MWFNKHPKTNEPRVRVMAVLSSESNRKTLQRAAERRGWYLSLENPWDHPSPGQFEIVLYDRELHDWRQAISSLAKVSPCVLLVSRVVDDALWQEVVELGGYELLQDPFTEEQALRTLEQAVRYSATVKR